MVEPLKTSVYTCLHLAMEDSEFQLGRHAPRQLSHAVMRPSHWSLVTGNSLASTGISSQDNEI